MPSKESKKKDKKGKGKNQKNEPQFIDRSEFLKDLIEKINNNDKIDYRCLRKHVHESAIDQYGSRYIQ